MKRLLVFFTLAYSITISAQSIGGGEVYYDLLSNKKYKVTAHVYRECSGAALNGLSGYVVSDSFKLSMNFNRISIQRINDTCGNPCANQNSASNKGYEKHTFIDTIDFNQSPYDKFVKAGNCRVHFAIQQALRPNTTNLNVNTTNNIFYLDAMVDICQNISKNSSPKFSIEPKFFACCYYQFNYNMGFLDTTDYDSIVLDISAPLVDFKSSVSYAGSYNQNIPATPYCPPNPGVINCKALPNAKPPRGFYFDRETGDIAFTPTKCDEISAIKVTASEYRKDSLNRFILIGYVSREMILSIKQCPDNNPPYLIGSSKITVCENNKICFNVSGKDDQFLPKQTVADTVTMYWDHGLSTATAKLNDSTSREKTMQFCWMASKNNGGVNNRFTVAANDKQCNIGLVSKGIIVSKSPSSNFKLDKDIVCNQIKYNITVLDSVNNVSTKNGYSVRILKANSNSQIARSFKKNDSFKINTPGTYIIESYVNNSQFNCPVLQIDTFSIVYEPIEIATNKDTLFCQYDSITLKPLNKSYKGYHLRWYDSERTTTLLDSNQTYSFRLNGLNRTISIETKDQNGCVLKDEVNVLARGGFKRSPQGSILSYCKQINDTLKVSNFTGKGPFTINWSINNQLVSIDSVLVYTINNKDRLSVSVTDSANCPYTDTAFIQTISPNIQLSDTGYCFGSIAVFDPKLDNTEIYKYTWFIDGIQSLDSSEILFSNIDSSIVLKLRVSTSTGCSSEKTIKVTAFDLPIVNIVGDSVYNKAHYISLTTDKVFNGYKWFNDSSTRSNNFWAYQLGTPGKYFAWVEVTDSNGCKGRDTLYFRTNGKTDVKTISINKLLISPNPFTNHIDIIAQKDGVYAIFDLNGKLIKTGSLKSGSQTIVLDDLAGGEYIISNGTESYKIIKTQ